MRYLVMGAGALGSIFGGFLAKNGRDVAFVGLDDHLKAIQKSGLTITGLWGEHHVKDLKAYYGTTGLTGAFDVVLLSVKSHITATACRQCLPFMHEKSLVVSIQNGLGNWETIAASVGWPRTIGGRIIFGAEVVRPGTARVTVYADKVLLGSPSGDVGAERIQEIVDDLNAAGIPCSASPAITSQLWGKVLYNCSLNALGAILDVPYGELVRTPESLGLIEAVIKEIFAVAEAKGVAMPYAGPEEYYRFLLERQIPPTAMHHSSMHQDISLGRTTEIDALNGAISRYGKEKGVPTPVNDVLTALIKGLEQRPAKTAQP
jgi:2-dehydropantoate 2-reductase